MKLINPIARKPGTSREAFRKHYEIQHAPLAIRYFQIQKYVRNHVIASAPEEVGFDVLLETWINPELGQTITPELDRIFGEDEHRFMKAPPRPVGVEVEETLLSGAPRGLDPPHQRKAAYLLSADGSAPADFLVRAQDWARALAAEAQAERAVLSRRKAPVEGSLFTYDAVVTLWLPENRALRAVHPPAGVALHASLLMEADETPPEEMKRSFGKR